MCRRIGDGMTFEQDGWHVVALDFSKATMSATPITYGPGIDRLLSPLCGVAAQNAKRNIVKTRVFFCYITVHTSCRYPGNDIYIYFRVHDEQTVMVVMNNNNEDKVIDRSRLAEILDRFSTGNNVLSSKTINLSQNFAVNAKTTSIWQLKK